jgi:uncharacterized membrane protein HdeD (DUF308 family)
LFVLSDAGFTQFVALLLPGGSLLLSPYLFGLVLLVVAVVDFAAAIGLWKLLNWGRMTALVISVISAITILGLGAHLPRRFGRSGADAHPSRDH